MYSKYPELTRRTFRVAYQASEGVVPVPDTVAITVIDVIKSNEEKALSLAVIKEFVASKDSKYKIVNKLIGVSDTCYGVTLATKSKLFSNSSLGKRLEFDRSNSKGTMQKTKTDGIYLPVNNSPHHVDSLSAIYGVREPATYNRSDLLAVIADLNRFLKTHGFAEIVPNANLVNPSGEIIGFISDGLYYYHSPQATSEKVAESDGKKSHALSTVLIPYDTADIDKAIFKRHGKPSPLDSATTNIANTELYDDYLYKLMHLEFASILQEERNETLRKDLIQAIRKANFHNADSLAKMSETITKLLEKYPSDQNVIKTIITEREEETVSFINNNVFEFDSIIISQLRDPKMTKDTVRMRLDEIMKFRVIFATKGPTPTIENIFTSCSMDLKSSVCESKKLRIDKEKYEGFLDIMTQDVTNQLKNPGMFLIASGVRNPMKFIIRDEERLYIV